MCSLLAGDNRHTLFIIGSTRANATKQTIAQSRTRRHRRARETEATTRHIPLSLPTNVGDAALQLHSKQPTSFLVLVYVDIMQIAVVDSLNTLNTMSLSETTEREHQSPSNECEESTE